MIRSRTKPEQDLYRKLKWLIFFRALFAAVLLGSVLIAILRPGGDMLLVGRPLNYLIVIALCLLLLSVGYAIVLPRLQRLALFAYIQIGIDTFLVTLVIFITGSFSSIFSFMYLVVIVYATMVIYRRGGMVTATLCGIQYGIMIDLEYYNILHPLGYDANLLMLNYDWHYVLYKLLITIAACYAVAFLSGFLSEQERAAKRELWAMEDQMKRVERLAAVGEMAAGLAHEIKNPLASLSGSIQMLRENIPYDPDQDRLMRIVLREAGRLGTLVNDFLMFAKPKIGKSQNVELDKALSEIVDLFASDPKCRSRIEIQKKFSGGLTVQIDPEHLRQVIWNLLINAAEAIDGGGRIEVALYPFKKHYACIAIADNGCGMPTESSALVFDPFYSTKPKGTGLGLSIVQQILGAYGGLIDIDSSPGNGTTVTLKLRLGTS